MKASDILKSLYQKLLPKEFYTFDGNKIIALNPDQTNLDTKKYKVQRVITPVTNGVNVKFIVTNISDITLEPPHFKLDPNNVANSITNLNRVFIQESVLTQQKSTNKTEQWADFTNQWYKLRGGGDQMLFPAIAIDNNKDITIGISCSNFNFAIVGFFNSTILDWHFGFTNPNTAGKGFIPHWIKPGETKIYEFYLRAVQGIGTNAVLKSWEPLFNWINLNKPFAKRPVFNGRIYGIIASDGNGDPKNRYFLNFPKSYGKIKTINASNASGWKEFLYSLLYNSFQNIEEFHKLGYKGMMVWATSGAAIPQTDKLFNYLPGNWSHLPENLQKTKHEILEFQKETGISVFMYWGYFGILWQDPKLPWNSDLIRAANGVYVSDKHYTNLMYDLFPPFDDVPSQKWTVHKYTEEYKKWIIEQVSDCLKYCSGIGCDAAPSEDFSEDAEWLFKTIREKFPNKHIWVETGPTVLGCRFVNPYQFGFNETRGPNESLQKLVPNYQAIYQDTFPSQSHLEKLRKYNFISLTFNK